VAGALRELLRIGVRIGANKNEWDGCSPLMLSAAQNDVYGMGMLVDNTHADGGEAAVSRLINMVQLDKARACALHYAADAAADMCVDFLLERHADPTLRNARGETPLAVAKRRAAAARVGASEEIGEAAVRCVEALEKAMATAKAERRAMPPPAKGTGIGRRKVSKAEAAARDAREAAQAAAAAKLFGGVESPRAGGESTGGEDSEYFDDVDPALTSPGGSMYVRPAAGMELRAPRTPLSPLAPRAEAMEGGDGGAAEEEEEWCDVADEDPIWDRPIGELLGLLMPQPSDTGTTEDGAAGGGGSGGGGGGGGSSSGGGGGTSTVPPTCGGASSSGSGAGRSRGGGAMPAPCDAMDVDSGREGLGEVATQSVSVTSCSSASSDGGT
jgi:hypothetical protein